MSSGCRTSEFLDDNRAYVSEEHFATIAKHRCEPGDVLIGTLGDPNIRACLLPDTIRFALNKADCVQLRPDRRVARAEYITWLLNLPETLRLAAGLVRGETRQRISMGRLRDMVVPVPPIRLQHRFAEAARTVARAKQQQTSAGARNELLFAALTHRAFSGELTAKWREKNKALIEKEMVEQKKILNTTKEE